MPFAIPAELELTRAAARRAIGAIRPADRKAHSSVGEVSRCYQGDVVILILDGSWGTGSGAPAEASL